MSEDTIYRLFDGLPRAGPGSDACTRQALGRCPALPKAARVLDLGCGPGAQTMVLAASLGTRIVAVDCHRPFLDQLEQAARGRGLGHLVETRCADMAALEEAAGSVDLIWSEGAIYLLGFRHGLDLWRPLLRDGGVIVVSECSWLTDDRPDAAIEFFDKDYPSMASIAGNKTHAEAAGFAVLDSFVLPPSAWWDDYYTPLLARIEALRPDADAALLTVIDEFDQEIALYRRHGAAYGYVFYVLSRRVS